LRAHALFWSSARHVPEALHLLEKAIERDPRYGPTLAWAARSQISGGSVTCASQSKVAKSLVIGAKR
jgi:hypothetical protein